MAPAALILFHALSAHDDAESERRSSSRPGDREAPRGATTSAADRVLLERLRANDAGALAELYDVHARVILRFAERYCPTSGDAEDVVHDVFVSLWERRAQLDLRGSWRVYLLGAARRSAMTWARHLRVVDAARVSASPDVPLGMSHPSALPDADVDNAALRAALDDAVARLTPTQRAAVMLRWYDQMEYSEIAEALGISVAAAKQQVSRVQRALRPLLARFFTP